MAEASVEFLDGSGATTGGLIIRKKKSDKDDQKPVIRASALGLDKLAGMVFAVHIFFSGGFRAGWLSPCDYATASE